MYCFVESNKWRVGLIVVSSAILAIANLSFFKVNSAYSQTSQNLIVCYSVVTVESGSDLRVYADQYNTTVADILEQNKVASIRSGATLTIQEKESKVLQTVSSRKEVAWITPINGVISYDYGWHDQDFHHGLDIAVISGSPVRASKAGRVTKAGWLGVYGYAVLIDHGNGFQTLYAHNSKLLVKVGDVVKAGEKISLSGNTGNSTGPHLHFEIRMNGKTVDPEKYLQNTQVTVDNENLSSKTTK